MLNDLKKQDEGAIFRVKREVENGLISQSDSVYKHTFHPMLACQYIQ